ncbi:MAG: FAD-dependent monooxygenase [Polyangiaceae bacterium]
MLRSEVELAIVGAGPAGLSTALFLQAHAPAIAARALVLEKARHPREKICAGAIGMRAERLLGSIGVRVDVPSSPLHGVGVRTERGELVLRRDAPIGRVVKRRAFDAALAEIARARGVSIREGAGLQRMERDAAGWTLTLADGETLRARAVVGADGVTSAVRRELGLPKGELMAQAAEVDTHRRATDGPGDIAMFDLTRRALRGYVWDFPTPAEGGPEVCRGVYQLRIGAGSSAAERVSVDEVLSAHVGDTPRTGPTRRFAERGFSRHEATAVGSAMLVGEAAGIDPVLGEGIAQAILYGATAGAFLGEELSRGVYDFRAWPAALRTAHIGLDVRARSAAVPLVYGARRGLLERWVTRSPALARVGMAYFAGDRVPRSALVGAALDLGAALLGPLAR